MTNKDFSKEEILKKIKEDITSENSNIPVINDRKKVYNEIHDILNVVELISETNNLEDLKNLLINLIITGSLKVNSPDNQNRHVRDYLLSATTNESEEIKVETSNFKCKI